jgi:electron-transferring-flavoprotein dehydrogenase
MDYNIVLVGGSPANLALAHRLVDLAKASGVALSIALLEKASQFGGHIVSGAVVKPAIFHKLFPHALDEGFPLEGVCDTSVFSVLSDTQAWDVPNALLPPGLRKEGAWVLTLSMVVGWMADQLKAKAKDVPNVTLDLFTGFSATEVLYDGDRPIGVSVQERTNNEPTPLENIHPDNALFGDVIVFGDKGFLSGEVIERHSLRPNPQLWSVGVKEVWTLPDDAPSYEGKVWHTLGAPLTDGTFGGGFVYGLKNKRLAVGLIASLDSANPNLNPQQLLQRYKAHPWLQGLLKGATLTKYGAALLPEGGLYSLPTEFAVDGALFVGDALGVLEVSELNGVANAMESGYAAAEVLHTTYSQGLPLTVEASLKRYKHKVLSGAVGQSLRAGRYFRGAWQNPRLLGSYLPHVLQGIERKNPVLGLLNAGLKTNPLQAVADATELALRLSGAFDFGELAYTPDHAHIKPDALKAKPTQGIGHGAEAKLPTWFQREDAVFYAGPRYHHGNEHIDEFNADTCVSCITQYEAVGLTTPCVADCTAEVHRIDQKLVAPQRVLANGELEAASDDDTSHHVSVKVHGMSLENCIQCRTCEIVCPEQNLKVRPTAQGSGPDFFGL